jgi:hypothetical protein
MPFAMPGMMPFMGAPGQQVQGQQPQMMPFGNPYQGYFP